MASEHDTPRIGTSGTTITCDCGAELKLGHPDNGPYICQHCRRFWSYRIDLTSEHEHRRYPMGAIRSLVRYARELEHALQTGQPIDITARRECTGVDNVMRFVSEELEWEAADIT